MSSILFQKVRAWMSVFIHDYVDVGDDNWEERHALPRPERTA